MSSLTDQPVQQELSQEDTPTSQPVLGSRLMPLKDAASAVDKSEQTIRRLVKAGRVPFQRHQTETGFIYLVDLTALQEIFQHSGNQAPSSLPSQAPVQPLDMPTTQPSQTATIRTGHKEGELLSMVTVYREENERLRGELQDERRQREARIQELIDAKAAAGKWEGMAESTAQFNQQLIQRLQLMERNPVHTGPGPSVEQGSEERVPAGIEVEAKVVPTGSRRYAPYFLALFLVLLTSGTLWYLISHGLISR